MRVDKVDHGATVDEMGCSIFGQLNGVKVHKLRWFGNVLIPKEYRLIVVSGHEGGG